MPLERTTGPINKRGAASVASLTKIGFAIESRPATKPIADGANAIAIGNAADAGTNIGAIAIGDAATVNAASQAGIAIGDGAAATGLDSICLGRVSLANGDGAAAYGDNAFANADGAIAIGQGAAATVATAVAIGAGSAEDQTSSASFDGLTGALQVPTGTTAQRPSTPRDGHMRYNTTIGQFEGWTGAAWTAFH